MDNRKMGFYVDMTACIGCRTCQIACKDKNDLPLGVLYRRVKSYETGRFPEPGYYHYSSACNHCTNPKCIQTCPTGAMHLSEDGTVQHNRKVCIRCQYCVRNCPYGVPQYFEGEDVIGKCDSCKNLREKDQNPACVDACLMRCLEWGELEELKKRYSGEEMTSDIAVLPSSEMTTPSVLIKPKKIALKDAFREVDI